MTTSFMEQAVEHGFVAAELTRLIKRAGFDAKLFQVYPVVYRASNKRAMRVLYTPRVADQLVLEYEIPARDRLESKALWQKRVIAELTEAWAAKAPPSPNTQAPTAPAPAPMSEAEKTSLKAALSGQPAPAVEPATKPAKRGRKAG